MALIIGKVDRKCITLWYCIKIQQTSSCGCVYSCVDLCIQEHRCLEAMGSGGQPIQFEHITDWSHAGRIIKDLPVNHSFFNATLYGADDRLDDIHNRLTWCTLLSQKWLLSKLRIERAAAPPHWCQSKSVWLDFNCRQKLSLY